MPSNNRLRSDQDEGLALLGSEAMKDNPQEPVHGPNWGSSFLGPLGDCDLVAESEDLNLQRGPCPKGRGQPDK
jgi:hypothetical protein